MIASETGRCDIVEYLINRDDVDCNITDNDGRTALMFAVRMGWTETVSLISVIIGRLPIYCTTDQILFDFLNFFVENLTKLYIGVPPNGECWICRLVVNLKLFLILIKIIGLLL